MNLFGKGPKQLSAEEVARQEASLRSIMDGGLPLNAIDRLTEEANRQASGQHFFTSDLSVSELALTHECGFLPLGQVMGSCVYNVGYQYMNRSAWVYASGELSILTQSMMNARQLAFTRLRQEAKLLRADGVVGVRFMRRGGELGAGLLEFQAIGTAVKRIGAPPIADGHEPFVSNLSGQDHWALRKAGYAPVGFAFGNCTWYQYPDWKGQSAMMSWRNAEVTSLTQGVYTARELAQVRLEADAMSVRAQGIVGVNFSTHVERIEMENSPPGYILHFTVSGTAIQKEGASSRELDYKLVVPVSDDEG